MSREGGTPPSGGPRVVALGDSLTYGVGDDLVPGAGAGWAAHVAHALGASSFVNLAANGTRARHLAAAQVPRALMARPDVVLLTVGGNDVLRGDFDANEVRECVAAALSRLARPGRTIVVVTIDRVRLFGAFGKRVDAVMATRVGLVNAAIRAAAAGTDAVVVDGAAAVALAGAAAWHIDGVHPSARGHRAIAQATLSAIAATYPPVQAIPPCGRPASVARSTWWLVRQGLPWVAKRSRDLIPQVAAVVTHELLEERRSTSRPVATR